MTNPSSAISEVRQNIAKAAHTVGRSPDEVTLIAVSKTYEPDQIRPALEAGQRHFGENRVQEAMAKWPALKEEFPDVVLHLIGPLQTNKVNDAVALFDSIHSVDRAKLARKLEEETARTGKQLQLFVQVNTGCEEQKAGVHPTDVEGFFRQCTEDIELTINGLMCIPPLDDDPAPHFALLAKLKASVGAGFLSMGMSADYEQAVRLGATHVRVGSAIFGNRV